MDIIPIQIPAASAPYVFMALLVIFTAGAIIAALDSRKPKESGESKPS